MDEYKVYFTCDTTRIYKFKIIIDDKDYGKIGHNECVPINLTSGKHIVYFKGFCEKTSKFDFVVDTNNINVNLKVVMKKEITSKILSNREINELLSNTNNQESNRKIKSVKVLGTRIGMETRILATYSFTIYSLLVVYDNDEREVIECKNDSDLFNELIQYIDIEQNPSSLNNLPVDEIK